jgi:DHA2 family multidrug resistance protein
MAMSVWAMGVVVAPILGPTLGGWITDNYSWRWIFYINLPVGIAAAMMAQAFVEDPPYVGRDAGARIDFVGFGLLAVWLSTLQVILDKGQQDDWFEATWIQWSGAVAVIAFIVFIIWELRAEDPVVNLRILANRNFAVGVTLVTLLGGVLYGTTAALPLFMQNLLGYPALQSGLALSPRGIGAFTASILVGRIVGKVSNRVLISFGFVLLATSSFMLGRLSQDIHTSAIVWPSVLNGLAISFIFVPLTASAMGNLEREQIGNATGVFNLMRNIGGSVGIAALTTLLARGAQIHQAMMVSHLSPFDPQYQERVAAIQNGLTSQQGAAAAAEGSLRVIYNSLLAQSSVWAFVDNFRLYGMLCLLCIPVAWMFKKVAKRGPAPAMH